MKLVLASKNQKKLAELREILSGLGVEVCSEADASVDVDVEETGTTFAENAMLKAQVSAQSDQMDFYEDCTAEMAAVVYA